jgi:hypothetical protein
MLSYLLLSSLTLRRCSCCQYLRLRLFGLSVRFVFLGQTSFVGRTQFRTHFCAHLLGMSMIFFL